MFVTYGIIVWRVVKSKLETRDDLGGDNGFDRSIGWIENDEGTVYCVTLWSVQSVLTFFSFILIVGCKELTNVWKFVRK